MRGRFLFLLLIFGLFSTASAQPPINTSVLGLSIPFDECQARVSQALTTEGYTNWVEFGNGWQGYKPATSISVGCIHGNNETVLVTVVAGADHVGARERMVRLVRNSGSPPPRVIPPPGPPPPSEPGGDDLGQEWDVSEQSGFTGIWRREGANEFSSRWERGGNPTVTERLQLRVNGNQVTATALTSSNDTQCTYTGTRSGDVIQGTYSCANYQPGTTWTWQARIRRGMSDRRHVPPLFTPIDPGHQWDVTEETGFRGIWQRAGSSGQFTARWERSGSIVTEELALQYVGNEVTARAVTSSNNTQCTYVGQINGDNVSGTYTCANYQPGRKFTWQGRIRR